MSTAKLVVLNLFHLLEQSHMHVMGLLEVVVDLAHLELDM